MKMPKYSQLLAAVITIFSLLFAQLAVASYSCPAVGSGKSSFSNIVFDENMPGCQGMQVEQPAPALCAAHCQNAPQSADTPSVPVIVAFIPTTLCVVVIPDKPSSLIASLPEQTQLARSGAPPLIVRNCCFRI